MITARPGSHVHQLLQLLSTAGEIPVSALPLIGNERVIKALVHKLESIQGIRFDRVGPVYHVRLVQVSGRIQMRTIRLYKKGLAVLDGLYPGLLEWYMSAFNNHKFTGDPFHIRRNHRVAEVLALCLSAGIEIRPYSVIYSAIDDVRNAMLGLIGPSYEDRLLGKAEVRETFHIAKTGTIAGCFVQEGLLRRNAKIRVVRDSVQIFEGRLASLKRFKDDAREVDKGFECGLSIDGFHDIKIGDTVECFEVMEVQATL